MAHFGALWNAQGHVHGRSGWPRIVLPHAKKTDWEECKENPKLNTSYLLEGCERVRETVTVENVVHR
jgi:hypothetical protein